MSNEQKHTPGPWKVVPIHVGYKITPAIDAGYNICSLTDFSDKAEADARFIAAAPETAAERDRLKKINAELLEALIWIADISDKNHDDPTLRAAGARTLRRIGDRADAAIARATGGDA